VVKLRDEISSLIASSKESDSNNESQALGRIFSLINIIKRSIKDDKLKEFSNIMHILEDSTKTAKQKEMTTFVEIIGLHYIDILKYSMMKKLTSSNMHTMIMTVLKKINDYFTEYSEILKCDQIDLQAILLKDAGIDMINAGFDDKYVNLIVDILRNIFYSIHEKKRIGKTLEYIFYNRRKKQNTEYDKKQDEIGCLEYKLEPNIIEYVGELATALYNRKKEPSSLDTSVEALFVIGAKSCQVREQYKRPNSTTSFIVTQYFTNWIEKSSIPITISNI